MAENGSLLSPTDKSRNHVSSIFTSPRLFAGFSSKGLTDTESVMSPTSILYTKPLAALKTPFWSDSQTNTPRTPKPETKTNWDKLDSRGAVLGLVDALTDEKSDSKLLKHETRMVLFGSLLKIQIPPLPPSVMSPNVDCLMSPADFGIKTRNSQLSCFSPLLSPSTKKSTFSSLNSGLEYVHSPRVYSGCLSADEMELSEDYTCVISHGPNPITIHIFDDCIIENCCGIFGFSTQTSKKENGIVNDQILSYPFESFLSFCYNCKKNLGQGKDIYMYRGEKAFCSSECRFKEIKSDEGIAKPDDIYET